jgi:hypothetical protein
MDIHGTDVPFACVARLEEYTPCHWVILRAIGSCSVPLGNQSGEDAWHLSRELVDERFALRRPGNKVARLRLVLLADLFAWEVDPRILNLIESPDCRRLRGRSG